jgi:hypothetical protein
VPWRMTDGDATQYRRALLDLVQLVDHPDMGHETADLTALLASVTALVVALAGLVRALRAAEPRVPKTDD